MSSFPSGPDAYPGPHSDVDFERCDAPLNLEPLPGALLLGPCNKLLKRGSRRNWPQSEVHELAALLAGCATISGSGANAAGAWAFTELLDEWSSFLLENPEVRKQVDPVYVTADPATGTGIPGALAAPAMPQHWPANLPPLMPVGNCGCMWTFPGGAQGHAAAAYLSGALRERNPGLVVRVVASPTPQIEYS
ncbi:hypothetical protein HYH03_013937 [Edaphochlamys debaryana]|uniref:Uncharacterized protein n=1 Tax=Edaphochlamys debaryana TaxID=47281 RepID=A0A835XPP5_9CHLO|nr:hypothetical protein HYH03_013937 [Edaphochlamys debaryana]|eukprot:KAG2487365.1 hypothetical protein HYH03_013937 [Edaphochlamys debaryana]